MSASAWVFMLIVWAIIIGNTVYCFWKLLTSERRLEE
jgi:heme/copper-type cytochrome/quinol oxidase subunit 2